VTAFVLQIRTEHSHQVAGQPTSEVKLKQAMKYLASASRPLVLRFSTPGRHPTAASHPPPLVCRKRKPAGFQSVRKNNRACPTRALTARVPVRAGAPHCSSDPMPPCSPRRYPPPQAPVPRARPRALPSRGSRRRLRAHHHHHLPPLLLLPRRRLHPRQPRACARVWGRRRLRLAACRALRFAGPAPQPVPGTPVEVEAP
jgi:hypothetical protein